MKIEKKYIPWLVRGAVLLFFLAIAWNWNRDREEKAGLARRVEELELEKKGFLQDREISEKELEKRAKRIIEQDAGWKAQVVQLEKILGENPRVIKVVEVRTKEVPVLVPAEDRPCPDDGRKVILIEGDSMHAKLQEVDFGTKAGNVVVTGKIEVWRDSPSRFLLHSQPLLLESPNAVLVPPVEPEPAWGAGAVVTLSKTGWAAGPKLMLPPKDLDLWLFETRAEADLGFALGPQGEHVVFFSAGGRFR